MHAADLSDVTDVAYWLRWRRSNEKSFKTVLAVGVGSFAAV